MPKRNSTSVAIKLYLLREFTQCHQNLEVFLLGHRNFHFSLSAIKILIFALYAKTIRSLLVLKERSRSEALAWEEMAYVPLIH